MENQRATNEYRIAVAVLAGGESSRMGKPKAELVRSDGTTFLEHICDEMSDFEFKYLSVNKNQSYCHDGFETVVDEYDSIGPMGGIVSVLNRAKESSVAAVLFVGCDMPFYTFNTAQEILNEYRGEDVIVPVANNKREPLASLYSTRILDLFIAHILKGEYKLTGVILRSRYREFDTCSPDAYFNINTPKEYETMER